MREVVAVVPHPRNPNKDPAKQLEQLAQVIRHQGWRNAIVVSKRSGFMVAGYGRLEAAEKLGEGLFFLFFKRYLFSPRWDWGFALQRTAAGLTGTSTLNPSITR